MNNKKRVRDTIGGGIVVIAMLFVMSLVMGSVEKDDINDTVELVRKAVSASVVDKTSTITGDSITKTNVTITGCERSDVNNILYSQLGQYEDEDVAAVYSTVYNEWFWEFINSPDVYGGGIYDKWGVADPSKKDAYAARRAWSYFLLGWAADAAGCKMTTVKTQKGFFIDSDIQRTYESSGAPGWFVVNDRAIKISTVSDLFNYAEKGDLIVFKSKDDSGEHHIAFVNQMKNGYITTVEGNLGTNHPRYVASRTIMKSMGNVWENLEVKYLLKPMYRSTATFYTDGGELLSMPKKDELWFDCGVSKAGNYYKYKFFEDLETYGGTITYLPTEDDVKKDGCIFLGWYDNPDLLGAPITQIAAEHRGNINLYAKWSGGSEDSYSSGVTHTEDGIRIHKQATWSLYAGESLSKDGNPYVRIELEVDPSSYYYVSSGKVPGEKGCYIADIIPQGFIPKWDSVVMSDESMSLDKTTSFANERKIYFRFNNGLEDKVYKASFVVEIDKTTLDEKYINGTYTINTNGYTVDTSHDNIGSCYFECDDIYAELASPRLTYTEYETEDLGNGEIIGIKKSASFGTHDGKIMDSNGNRYVDIEFEIDLSETTDDVSYVEVLDYLPAEYELFDDTAYVTDYKFADITFDESDRSLVCTWEKESGDKTGLEGNIFYVSFKAILYMNRIDIDYIKQTPRLFTNGKVSDVSKSSEGSSVITIDGERTKLESPYLDCTNIARSIKNITLHTNGGILAKGANVTNYIEGVGGVLPGSNKISKDGYMFVGWYDNPDFEGDYITQILPEDTGDKEFWAKWLKEGEFPITKTSELTTYNSEERDENGNPYVKTRITLDLNAIDFTKTKYKNQYPLIVDYLPSEYELIEDYVMANDANIEYSFEDSVLGFHFEKVNVNNDVFIIEFKTKLDLNKAKQSLIANNGTVYTNGTTLDIKEDSSGSVYVQFAGNKNELASPTITTEVPYDVVLHTNGGTIKKGREVKRYFAGEVTPLPDEYDMSYAGYEFIGWYDNKELTGKAISFIPSLDKGDKQYWAKWEASTTPQSVVGKYKEGINLIKSAQWTIFEGRPFDDDGNPYVKISFDVDFTNYQGALGGEYVLKDTMPSNFKVIWQSHIFRPQGQSVDYKFTNDKASKRDEIEVTISNVEKKIYTFAFIAQLNLDNLGNEYLVEEKPINTNGTTIDSNTNSEGSSSLLKGNNNLIELASPTVCCSDLDNSSGELGLTKRANWTTYQGQKEDSKGNPYINIEFDADLRNANLYKLNKLQSADVIMLMDFSGSMDSNNAGKQMVTHAKNFISMFLAYEDIPEKKVAVATYSSGVEGLVSLKDAISSNATEINAKIDRRYAGGSGISGGTDIQSGIIWAQRELMNNSTADKKIIVVISDGDPGEANTSGFRGPDVITGADYYSSYAAIKEQTKKQMDYAKANIPNLEVISLGLNVETSTREFLKLLCSTDSANQERYYEGVSYSGSNLPLLDKVFADVLGDISMMNEFSLVDLIPAECSIVNGTVKIEDEGVTYKILDDRIVFTFDSKNMRKKIYTFSFITKMDYNKSKTYINKNNRTIYTNGVTVDTSKDSMGSAYLGYGENIVKLESPILKYGYDYKVKLHTNGGTLAAGKDVTGYDPKTYTLLPTKADIFKKGYDFVGWYDNENFMGKAVIAIDQSQTGDKNYYAKWQPKVYKVKLHTNGGTFLPDGMGDVTSYVYGKGTPLPTGYDLVKDGYDFAGWYDNAGMTGTPISEITPYDIEDKELWAKWEKITVEIIEVSHNVYTVSYDETIYKTATFEAFLDEMPGTDVEMYLTATSSKTTKPIGKKYTAKSYETVQIPMPEDMVERVAKSKQVHDETVYLQMLYSGKQRIYKITIRKCTSFSQN